VRIALTAASALLMRRAHGSTYGRPIALCCSNHEGTLTFRRRGSGEVIATPFAAGGTGESGIAINPADADWFDAASQRCFLKRQAGEESLLVTQFHGIQRSASCNCASIESDWMRSADHSGSPAAPRALRSAGLFIRALLDRFRSKP
jgi:hypothetical protein